jgi:hypothetical protein
LRRAICRQDEAWFFVLSCDWRFLPELGPPRPFGLAGFFLFECETIWGATGQKVNKQKFVVRLSRAGFTATGPASKKFLRRFFQKAAAFL